MRHTTLRLADTEIGGWLAEQHRKQLGVDIGDVDKRNVAERLETQELGLGQVLLRQSAGPTDRKESRGRGHQLGKFAP